MTAGNYTTDKNGCQERGVKACETESSGISLAIIGLGLYNQQHMSRPFKLYRLQQIDTQLDQLRSRVNKIESELADDSELRQAEERAATEKGILLAAQKKLHQAEYETQQQRIKIEQTESALYGGKVRNPKELQDLQNELGSLKRHLSVLDERQFEAMLQEESANQQYQSMLDEQSKIKLEHANRTQQLTIEKDKLLKEIKNSETERAAAENLVEPGDISVYLQLRQKRRGIAVSKIVDKACAACGSTLSAALLNAAHSPNQLNYCESCGRILYLS